MLQAQRAPLTKRGVAVSASWEFAHLNYTSCAPQIIYRNGGFFEPQEQLTRLYEATAEASDCEFVGELYPPYTVSRPVPDYLTTQSEAFRANLASQSDLFNRDCARGAGSGLVLLKNATLHSSVLYTTSEAGFRPVYETHRQNDRPYVSIIDSAQAATDPINLSETAVLNVFIGSVGSFNYGHFLVDDLPRIKAIPHLASLANGGRIRILVTSFGDPIDQVRMDALLHICRNFTGIEVALARRDKSYYFDSLYYVTPVSYHPVLKSPDALAFVADRMAVERDDPDPAGARIFVTRRADRSRALLNVSEIEQRLTIAGFEVVDPEGLSFVEQARVFGRAQIIVGCMGAAMTNCVFAHSGAWTVYLGPEGWMEPFYWDIAAVRGHHYLAVYGNVADLAKPAHLSSYTIQLDALEGALALLPPLNAG